MAHLRQRKNSDPENFTQGGAAGDDPGDRRGRAAGGSFGGGRGGTAAIPRVGSTGAIPRVGGTAPPGDANLDMDIIEEEVEEHVVTEKKKKKKKKNRANDNTTVRFSWMRTENNRFLLWLSYLLGILAMYSSVMAPLTYAFKVEDSFPDWILIIIEVAFLLDILREWICACIDDQTMVTDDYIHILYRIMLDNPRKFETLAVIPWYYTQWKYLVWTRIFRAMRGKELLEKMEKCENLNYVFIRFVKLMAIQVYRVHTTGCIFYQLVTTSDGQNWMSGIELGDQNLFELGITQKYMASTYFAIVTLSTVGYGDIHATNPKEMLALTCLIILSLTVWTYLGLNLANLFARRSKTQIIREKMDNIEKYLRKTNVAKELAKDIRDYMEIKYSDDYEKRFLEDVPDSLRAKITRNFNESILQKVSLFKGCSPGFLKHLASEVHENFYAPGYTLLEEGNVVHQLYILYAGGLELLQGGIVDTERIRPTEIFGLKSFLLNEPLLHTYRAYKISKVLAIRKNYFMESLDTYLEDAARVMKTLSMVTDSDFAERISHSVFGIQMQKDAIMKTSLLNHAVYVGDLEKVKKLVQSGVNVNSVDYSDTSPLDVATVTGRIEIANFLIQEGAIGKDVEHVD